jgi:hypothetical protein
LLSPFADDSGILRVINAAQNVPSAHKPWSFWIRADDRIELRANFGELDTRGSEDRIRRLGIAHPLWREPVISCGAALFNLRLAIRVTGHDVAAWLLPEPDTDPSLLASVEIVTGRVRRPSVSVQELYDAIPRRSALPEPFSGPPAPENVVAAMVVASFAKQGWLRLLNRPQAKRWLKEAASAGSELAASKKFQDERRKWTGGGTGDLGAHATGGPREDQITDSSAPVGSSPLARVKRRRGAQPQLMTLSTRADRPLDWLRAGQAMQRALLIGARYGVSASFLTQPLQLADVQASLAGAERDRGWPWKWPLSEVPQAVLRVGAADPAGASAAQQDEQRFPEVLDLRGGLPRQVLSLRHLAPSEAA